MDMLRLNSRPARWIGVWAFLFFGGCTLTLLSGEKNFDLFYLSFRDVEIKARDVQASHGDELYLSLLYSERALSNVKFCYTNYGAHPEVAPPNQNPDEDEKPTVVGLNAGREFIQRNYLYLWAAAYVSVKNAPIDDEGALENRDPFADLDGKSDVAERAVTGPTRRGLELKRDQLGFFYSEDLFLQKRVEELARRHGEDDSELVAGLTGRQIIAYMREHLPEPDPRVTRGGSILPQTRPIVDPDKRFLDGGGSAIIAGSSVDNKARRFLWPLLGLLLMACAWGFIFVRKARQ